MIIKFLHVFIEPSASPGLAPSRGSQRRVVSGLAIRHGWLVDAPLLTTCRLRSPCPKTTHAHPRPALQAWTEEAVHDHAACASAYLETHSAATLSCLTWSDLRRLAISGSSGSSGLGSVSSEQMLSSTLLIVSAGDHCVFRMSRQMLPLPLTLQ